ncbi:MAG: signal peptide peptidase SppA [Schleiferiaceae bacterium]
MKQFFGALIGSFVGFFLLIAVLIGFGIGAAASGADPAVSVPEAAVLHLELDGSIAERPNELNALWAELLDEPAPLSLYELTEVVRGARESNGQVTAIWLDLGGVDASWAALTELRAELSKAKKAGITVVATSKAYDPKSYYLASVAKKIYLAPAGMVVLNGLSASPLYLKGALDKLGVKAHLVRGSDNAFKSAGEPFVADEMSEANRLQYTELLGGIWSEVERAVRSSRRSLSDSSWSHVLNQEPLLTGQRALALGLVDALAYPDELALSDWGGSDDGLISAADYLGTLSEGSQAPRIAVVFAEGDVVDGSDPEAIADFDFNETVEDLLERDDIEGVVLRINSPGGSALASDEIHRGVTRLAEAMPVVVSMGGAAASGGYYMAAPAREIWAQPTTITGSIGVFGLLFSGEELLHDKLGVKSQPVATHPFANFPSLDRTPTEAELAVVQRSVDQTYARFKEVVAQGRRLEAEVVDSIARGRVYTGRRAKELGLVDQLGGLNDALASCAKLAKITTYQVEVLPQSEEPWRQALREVGVSLRSGGLEAQLERGLQQLRTQIQRAGGIQARETLLL